LKVFRNEDLFFITEILFKGPGMRREVYPGLDPGSLRFTSLLAGQSQSPEKLGLFLYP